MKKILLLLAFLIQITFSFAQKSQWAPYVKSSCFQGLSTSAISYGYSEGGKGYAWNWKIKNNYTRTITFNLSLKIGANKVEMGSFTLQPGAEHQHVSMYFSDASSNWMTEVTSAYFGTYASLDADKCWLNCDNGTPNCEKRVVTKNSAANRSVNTPATTNANGSANPTAQQNNLDAYNQSKQKLQNDMNAQNAAIQRQNLENANKRQQFVNVYNEGVALGNTGKYTEAAAKYQQAIGLAINETDRQTAQNAYNKVYRTDAQIQGVNQLAKQTIDLVNAIKQDKIARAAEKEKEAYDKTNTLSNPKMFESFFDFIVSALAAEGFKYKALTYYGADNSKYANLDFDGVKVTIAQSYLSNKWMNYSYEFGAYNGDCKNRLDASNLLTFLRQYDRYEVGSYGGSKWDNYTFKIATFKLETSGPLRQMYNNGYVADNYKGAASEIAAYLEGKNNQKKKDAFSYIELANTATKPDVVLFYTRKVADAYFDKEQLNDRVEALKWYRKAADVKIEDLIKKPTDKGMYESTFREIYFKLGFLTTATDGNEAINWYLKSDVKDETGSCVNIGLIYEAGKGGIEKDWKKALEWYEKDADRKSAKAMYYISLLYKEGGPNLPQDRDKAEKWLKKACKIDNKYCSM